MYLVHLYFMISLLLFSVLSWEKGVIGLLLINQYQSINQYSLFYHWQFISYSK